MSDLICDIHDKIYDVADRAIKNIPRYYKYSESDDTDSLFEMCEFMDSHIDDLKYALDDIMKLVLDAKERGQAMEDRLIVYVDAIEGLGFERKR